MSEADLTARSVAAVTGWVTAIEAAADPETGGVNTYISIDPDEVVFGSLPAGTIVLRETGGRLRGESEWMFGSPEYRVGEEVLVFLTQNDDGTLRTTAMAMGKFDVEPDRRGTMTAVRKLGEGVAVWNPRTRQLETEPEDEVYDFGHLKAAVRRAAEGHNFSRSARRSAPQMVPPELSRTLVREAQASFTYLSSPSRWFEPDEGQSVPYVIDATGDVGVGPANSRAAMNDAFAAWTDVPTSPLALTDGGDLPAPLTFAGCTGGNRIVFNDPFNEISDPSGCSGVLAIGGYCASSETRTVNGTSFRRIRVAKITFNNGWSSCGGWNRCNMAEVATHEIGHTLGFGHSADYTATMYASAHFDGRCASLRSDDLTAVNFVYPGGATPTVGPPTATPTPTFTATPTIPPATPTGTRTQTRTATPTNTPPPATVTATRTNTPTRTLPPTATASPTNTPTVGPQRRVRGRVEYYRDGRAVPAVTVNLKGVSPDSTLTTESGEYEFAAVPDGSWELGAEKFDDFGTGVSPLDAAYVLQYVAQLRALDSTQQMACDVTGDGTLSTVDAARILQFTVGMMDRLPVSNACDSDWLFMPVPAPMHEQSVINPEVGGGICREGSIMLDEMHEDMDGQDFRAVLFGDCTGNWQAPGEHAPIVRAGGRAPQLRLGRLMIDGGTARVPVYVRSGVPYQALDLLVSYDAARLTPAGAQLRKSAASGITSYNAPQPGLMRVAMASGEPIKRRHGVLLVLNFTVQGDAATGDIRAMSASVDERPAVIAAQDAL